MPIRGNKDIRYANTTQKVRRQWNAREKLIIIINIINTINRLNTPDTLPKWVRRD